MTGACALIPAAGRGVRFGGAENKVFAPLLGRPVLGWTLQAFADAAGIDSVVLIGNADDLPRLREIGARYGGGKVRAVIQGGSERQASVRLGLAAIGNAKWVVIHDAARPCVTPQLIADCLFEARQHHAAYAALPLVDTIVRSDRRDSAEPVPREGLWVVQTPQAFGTVLIRSAHAKAVEQGWTATDDAGLVRMTGHAVHRVDGSPENLKVTHPEDIAIAEAILGRRSHPPAPSLIGMREGESENPTLVSSPPKHQTTLDLRPTVPDSPSLIPMREGAGGWERPREAKGVSDPERGAIPFRIGHGYDVHQFADNRPLWLGGVHFPDAQRGLLGHSDADVLLHAICDALLGAAGMGDIGILFPPSDMRHKDRPSIEFLLEVKDRLDDAGWRVGNIDATVLAEAPKIGPRVGEIKACIAEALGIDAGQIGIKATTNEGMGFVGRGEGIAAHATALLLRA